MAVSHVENFNYSDWSITRDVHTSHVDLYSSGTASKLSRLYPISKAIGNITATVYGGFGWVSAYKDYDQHEDKDSLYCNLTVTIYLVTSNGQKIAVASATGSASRGGYLDCYNARTSQSLTFNTANITEQQRQLYEYIQIGYSCITSKSSGGCEKVGSFSNGGTGNPTGSASITIRDTINVNYDGTEMTNLYFDGNEMSGLRYDGNVIF